MAMTIFLAALSLTGCKDKTYTKEYVVFDGAGKDVEYLVAADSVSTVKLAPLTVVEIVGDYDSAGEFVPFTAEGNIHGYISKSKLKQRAVWYEKNGERLTREPFFYEKLYKSGSSLSGKLFGYVEQLHFNMYDYNTVLWAILFIIGAAVTGCLIFPLVDGDGDEMGKYYGLIPTATYLFTVYCAYILFVVQDPFNISAHSGWGWFADLLIFLGLVGAGIGVYLEFNPVMESLVPSTAGVKLNTIIITIITLIYGLCLWLAKGAADTVLWGIIIVQACFTLYILITGIMRGEAIGAIVYAIVYPLCYAVILTSLVTLGFMVFILAAFCVGGGSLLTQPQNYGSSGSSSSTSDMITDSHGNHHYVASENNDGTVTTTDGSRMRRRADGTWEDM